MTNEGQCTPDPGLVNGPTRTFGKYQTSSELIAQLLAQPSWMGLNWDGGNSRGNQKRQPEKRQPGITRDCVPIPQHE